MQAAQQGKKQQYVPLTLRGAAQRQIDLQCEALVMPVSI